MRGGTATQLMFSSITPQTIFTSFPITIMALDQFGNLATSFTSSATLSALSGNIYPTTT